MARPNGGKRFWTPGEVAVLRANRHLKIPDLLPLLPGRSPQAVMHMRHRLRLQYVPPAPIEKEPDRIPGRPFITSSGIKAMQLSTGPVAYVSGLYD